MDHIERHPWEKYVTVRAVGLGAVPFLQNHDRIPRMAVYKVYPEFGVTHFPPPEALY